MSLRHGRMAQLVVPTGTFSRMRDVDVNRLLASRSLESTESSPKSPNILGEIVRKVRIRSHGSVGRTYWPMYITTSSLPGSASGSTKFCGLPHLPSEESVDRPVMKSPSGSPNSPTFRGCKTTWSHGSVGRAHRSHRWGHRFESCCDHHAPGKLACQVFSYLPYRHT